MTRRTLALCGFLALLLVLPPAPLHAGAALGRLEGRVTDTTGTGLQDVIVTAVRGAQARITTSAADGRWVIVGLTPGAWVVRFRRTGFAVSSLTVTVPEGGTAQAIVTLQASSREQKPAEAERRPAPAKPSPKQEPIALAPPPAGPPAPDPAAEEEANTEEYDRIDDNAFHRTASKPLSTFSIDVDTASYANVRRFLREGHLPPKDAVRVEELVNYFRYDYAPPKGREPFSITTEVGPAPWAPKHRLVHIGLQTRPIEASRVPPRNLVFLIDVSGSMEPANKLPLLKQAMALLVEQLRPEDRVAIVVYAGSSGLVLPSTPGTRKDEILASLGVLEAGGSTNGGEGIVLAYRVAEQHFLKGGINRVILATDGDFNVGVTNDGDLTRLIEQKRKSGVFLTVLGFGMGNYKDSRMEKLADRGNGNYAYIDTIDEARKVLVREAGATLVTVAKDVKIQLEMNPARVAGWRLIGYENRLLRDEDFNDDAKDAGEIGAGHSVTALYEIVPTGEEVPGAKVDDLKYQKKPAAAPAADSFELMTVKIRYKAPDRDVSQATSRPVTDTQRALAQTSHDFRFSAAVAGFGMLLRDSPFKGQASWKQVAALARGAVGQDPDGYRRQFLEIVSRAASLSASHALAQ